MEANTSNTQNNNAQTDNQSNAAGGNKANEMMEMLTAGLGMLQGQAGKLPEMLGTAGTAVANTVKNMSTTRKVVGAGVIALGAYMLVRNMKGKKNSNGQSKKSNKR